MRDIKFKYYWKFDDKLHTAIQYLDYAGDWEVEYDDRDFDTFENIHVKFLGVVQYTGLKDINGKEIYEDDLIMNGSGRICRVVWFETSGMWDARVSHNVGNSHGFNPHKWKNWVEVIGNIYEKPECPGEVGSG